MSDLRPNIVLVTADSLRADYCGYVGGGDLTPTLDELAREGVAFENAIAPGPQTFSSMPAAFTGEPRDPAVFRSQDGEGTFERRLESIAAHLDLYAPIQERLQEFGYETAAITPNPWTSRAAGFDRGFDCFVDCSTAEQDGRLDAVLSRLPGVDAGVRPVELLVNKLTGRSFFTQWEGLYDDLLAVRAALSEPYFLWVFLMDTHVPYITTRRHREENSLPAMYYAVARSQGALRGRDDSLPDHVRRLLLRSYRDAVRATDRFLDRLRSDLARDHVLVVHSDHGESLGEHGNFGHHHRRVYEENIHVPFVVHGAGVAGHVKRPTTLRTLHDVIHELARRGTFDPTSHTDELVCITSELHNHRAVRGRRWKYVEDDGGQLFNLWADPGESRNLADAHPELVEWLGRQLESHDQHLRERARISESADEMVAGVDV